MLDRNIEEFIQSQKLASFCCCDEDGYPHCFNCFYAFDSRNCFLVFKSSASSLHGKILENNPRIAGTILPSKINFLALKGIQFAGQLLNDSGMLMKDALILYHKKFPFALAMSGEIYVVQLEKIKLTDNGKGFGKKINWQRAEMKENERV